MFDKAKYGEYKLIERKIFDALSLGRGYETWMLSKLMATMREKCSSTPHDRIELVSWTSTAIKLRCQMAFSWRGRRWYDHMAFVGVLVLLRAELSVRQQQRQIKSLEQVSETEVEHALQAVFGSTWKIGDRRTYWSTAADIWHHEPTIPAIRLQEYVAIVANSITVLARSGEGRRNLVLAGFLAFMQEQIGGRHSTTSNPSTDVPQPATEGEGGVTMNDLEYDVFFIEVETYVNLILDLWKNVSALARLGPTALASYCVWLELRSVINSASWHHPEWPSRAIKNPGLITKHKPLIMGWSEAIRGADCRIGILYDSLQDLMNELPSAQFGLDILLRLHHTCGPYIECYRPNAKRSLEYCTNYVHRIIEAIPDAFSHDPSHTKAVTQLDQQSKMDLHTADMVSAGLILAKVTAEAYDNSLILMNYPQIGALSHYFVMSRLGGSLGDNQPGIQEFEKFLKTFERIIFLNGYPQNESATERSLAEWVLPARTARVQLNKRFASGRTDEFTSSFRRLSRNQYSIRALVDTKPAPQLDQACKDLIQRISVQEQMMFDVLAIYECVPLRTLVEMMCFQYTGSVHALISDLFRKGNHSFVVIKPS